MVTTAKRRVLEALQKYGPQFNGTLASHTDLVWNSRVFKNMEREGLIEGHPYEITDAGKRSAGRKWCRRVNTSKVGATAGRRPMSDEPRQPQPVQIVMTGKDVQDVNYWMRHIKRACEFKGDLVEQQGSTQLTIYPRAVND
jgi:hypothetical protein